MLPCLVRIQLWDKHSVQLEPRVNRIASLGLNQPGSHHIPWYFGSKNMKTGSWTRPNLQHSETPDAPSDVSVKAGWPEYQLQGLIQFCPSKTREHIVCLKQLNTVFQKNLLFWSTKHLWCKPPAAPWPAAARLPTWQLRPARRPWSNAWAKRHVETLRFLNPNGFCLIRDPEISQQTTCGSSFANLSARIPSASPKSGPSPAWTWSWTWTQQETSWSLSIASAQVDPCVICSWKLFKSPAVQPGQSLSPRLCQGRKRWPCPGDLSSRNPMFQLSSWRPTRCVNFTAPSCHIWQHLFSGFFWPNLLLVKF